MINHKLIVFKIPEFPHISETFVIAQINTAIKLGYSIKIITRKIISSNLGLIDKLQLTDNIIIENYNIPKNKILRLLKWSLLLLYNFKNLGFIIKFYKEHTKFSLTWLYEWLFYKQFNDANIIHVQYGTNKYPFDLLKKIKFLKPSLIVTFHGHDAFFPINGFIPNNGYYDYLFRYGSLVTVNTPYLAEKVLNLGCPEKILKIIPVGVDTSFFYPLLNLDDNDATFKLITVGRLDPVKGQSYCIEAVRMLIEKGLKVTLTIIGEGSERSNLETLIKKNHVEDVVFMRGKKSQSEIRDSLRQHDLYLLTGVALPDGRRETQGLATLEAQACGLPVIAFDSGGIKYTIEDSKTGFLCKEYDINDLVLKIEQLYQNRALLKKMSQNTVDFIIQNYSQKEIDKKWQMIYSDLSNEN